MEKKQNMDFEKIGKDIEKAVNEQLSQLKKEAEIESKPPINSNAINQVTSVPNLGSIL